MTLWFTIAEQDNSKTIHAVGDGLVSRCGQAEWKKWMNLECEPKPDPEKHIFRCAECMRLMKGGWLKAGRGSPLPADGMEGHSHNDA
jgi:hypothetical protein